MTYIRDGAEAFGWYSWIILICLVAIPFLMSLFGVEKPTVYLSAIILGLLSIPRIITSIARPCWNMLHKPKYERERALDGFLDWWKRFSKGKTIEHGRLNVVYGHTHLLDILHYSKALQILGKSSANQDIELINLPAWVTDSAEKGKYVFRYVFLYIDDEGFELFGWDTRKEEAYHIPKWAAERIGDKKALKVEEIESIRKLGFPDLGFRI